MLVSVIGVQRKNGAFHSDRDNRDIVYDNVILHSTREDRNVHGACVEALKVKTDLVEKALGSSIAEGGALDSLVGLSMNIAFNRYGNVEMLEIL